MPLAPFGPYGFNVAVLLISIMISVSGILLALGYAIDDKKLKEIGRRELYQSIVNGILVGSLLFLFINNGPISVLVNSLMPKNSSFSCPSYMSGNAAMCFAYSYLAGSMPYTFMGSVHISLLEEITFLISSLFILTTLLGAISSIEINLLIVTLNFSYLLKPFMSQINYIIEALSATAVSISVQAFILVFASLCAISIILPLGIILRTFYPTRKLGSFFIALSIGIYVILPLSYLFDATMLNSYSTSYNATILTISTSNASSLENQIISSQNNRNQTSIVSVIESSASSLASSLARLVNSLITFISELIMQVFILPVFSLVITGISIKEISELLGSEASFGKFRVL